MKVVEAVAGRANTRKILKQTGVFLAVFSIIGRPDMGTTLGAPGVYHQYLADMRIQVLDSRRVRLTTAAPLADLLDILSTGYILPPGVVEPAGGNFKHRLVGSGPYEFVEHRAGDRIRVQRSSGFSFDTPGWEAIEWRYVPDPAQRVQMAAENRAQIATLLQPADLPREGSVAVSRSRGPTAYILMYNAARGPFQDRRRPRSRPGRSSRGSTGTS